MRKRLQHLPTALVAMGILLVLAAPLAWWRDGGTGALPLDRPQARSAIGDAMRAELARTMDGLEVLQ